MKIIVDAFGGDNAPLSNIEGARGAADEFGARVILCGDEAKLRKCAKENNISLDGIEILHADDVISVKDEPNALLKAKSDSSMAVAFKATADGTADAIVSAGNSGAVLIGATFVVKRIKGIKRPAFTPVMPTTDKPYILVDGGANIDCTPAVLHQFALLGNAYMKSVLGVKNPRVGLLNIGEEESKGGEVLQETYTLLKDSNLNFVGNVEPRDVPYGACDVLVCDGFAGNIVLKLTEGVAMSLMGMIKQAFVGSTLGKIAAALVMKDMRKIKRQLDYTEHGGAPVIGVTKPVIKAHGSSNGKAMKFAIKQATEFAKANLPAEIEKSLN